MWFFFSFWNDMEIIWWNDNKKRWLFVKWKHEHHAQLTNFASVRNSMVPNLNLLSSLTTLAVKKQAQFNEKNIYKKTNFDCKKNYYATNLQWAWSTKKSSNWISFLFPDQFFPMPRSIWHFWTVIGGILTKKIEKKKIISANSRIFHSHFSNLLCFGSTRTFCGCDSRKTNKNS